MAKKMPEGKRFPKGQSGNPNGRPPILPEVADEPPLDKASLSRLLNKIGNMDQDELKEFLAHPKTKFWGLWLGKIAAAGASKGDHTRLEFYLNWAIGPLKSHVELSGPNGGPIQTTTAAINLGKLSKIQLTQLQVIMETASDDSSDS